ncbi:hypothetical protein HDV00_012477 [Rhizophlyctis rosea]|nr:hypothetical protein HDV00_012477 [Rhizophlyctis rosea]
MRLRNFIIISLVSGIAHVTALPNPVIYWNDQVVEAIKTQFPPQEAPLESRTFAIVQGAVWTAAIDAKQKKNNDVEEKIAVSFAAHDALAGIFPEQSHRIDHALKVYLDDFIKDNKGKTTKDYTIAKQIGEQAASHILAEHAYDGYNRYVPYESTKNPPPGPVALSAPIEHFRPPPPPEVSDPKYKKYLDEVAVLGEKNSKKRTKYETESAYFWNAENPPTRWNNIAKTLLHSQKRTYSTYTLAFNFALLNNAIFDAGIAVIMMGTLLLVTNATKLKTTLISPRQRPPVPPRFKYANRTGQPSINSSVNRSSTPETQKGIDTIFPSLQQWHHQTRRGINQERKLNLHQRVAFLEAILSQKSKQEAEDRAEKKFLLKELMKAQAKNERLEMEIEKLKSGGNWE